MKIVENTGWPPVYEVEEVASIVVEKEKEGLFLSLRDSKDGAVVRFIIPMALNFNLLWRELKNGAEGLVGRVFHESDFGQSVCVAREVHVRFGYETNAHPEILGDCDGVTCEPVIELPRGTTQAVIDYFGQKRPWP